MRILFLTHRLPYAPNRGDRIRAYHLLRTLAPDARIDLLSLVHDEEEASHAGELRSWLDSVTVARVPRTTNRVRAVAALPGSRPLTHVLLDSPDVGPALRAICTTQPPDVVLAYCSGMAQYLFDPILRGVPALIDMVDVDSAKWNELSRVEMPPKSWIFKREAHALRGFEARAAMHAFATLAVNEREHRALAALAPSARIETVQNGIDYQRFRPTGPPSPNPVVVFCGVMNYAPNERGARWMVDEVWPQVRAQRADAQLIIVGSNPTRSVRALQNEAIGVAVTGEVPDVRPYLWNAAVAVAPIWIARGLQNKVLEAAAAGLPCVVTPAVADGLPLAPRSSCRIAEDHGHFAAAVVDLLNTAPHERRAIAARADVAAFDWSSQLASVISLLGQASESRRLPALESRTPEAG